MHLFQLNNSLAHSCALNQTEYADDFRVLLVGFVGSGVALTSILENLVIFYVFSTSRKLRRQNYANPVLLAFFDIVVSLCYIFMASMQVIAYRYEILPLVVAWVYYLRVLYCLQHFALTVSNFLLVVASIERYLANGICYVQLTIVGCALRLPIYVVNDHRIRKAIFRAILRCRYRKSQQFKDIAAGNLEKWSIVIVSNSLRSNLTGAFNQEWPTFKGKKSFDQLGALLQDKRRLIVQMTINLANDEENKDSSKKQYEESMMGEKTCLTDIQEEDSELMWEHRKSICSAYTYSSISHPTPVQQQKLYHIKPSNI